MTARVRRRRSLLTSNVDEQVNALSVVQLFGRATGEQARFDRQNERLTDALLEEANCRGLLRGISSGTGWAAMVVAFLVGAREVNVGTSDIGTIMVAILATRVMQAQVRALSLSHDYWRRAEISRRKLEDFLNSRSRLHTEIERIPFVQNRARIAFTDVRAAGSLNGVTASIGAGQHVAVVGPSSSGKTSLLHTVCNLLELQSGAVLIGDQRVDRCDSNSLWRKIGFIGPDLPLMRGTLHRNLTYRRPSTTDAELRAHIARCCIESVITSLPGGLDFWITEGGLNLPVGTRQQIIIARGLLGNPPLLLLDHPTLGMDEESRANFRALLGRYSATILNVTDDLEEIALADTVWTMRDGRIVEQVPASSFLSACRHRPIASAGRQRA